jgi:hypothetical protein
MRKAVIMFALLLAACNRQSELKPIQQQRSGQYAITLLNDTGVLKQNNDRLRLEVRNASTNELANVNNLKIQASMLMPGMGPMFGTLSTPQQVGPGQYELDANMGMAGQWNVVVTFDPDVRTQFALRAQ